MYVDILARLVGSSLRGARAAGRWSGCKLVQHITQVAVAVRDRGFIHGRRLLALTRPHTASWPFRNVDCLARHLANRISRV